MIPTLWAGWQTRGFHAVVSIEVFFGPAYACRLQQAAPLHMSTYVVEGASTSSSCPIHDHDQDFVGPITDLVTEGRKSGLTRRD
jgi:hypothetical protein